jgi:hypothetical protein
MCNGTAARASRMEVIVGFTCRPLYPYANWIADTFEMDVAAKEEI